MEQVTTIEQARDIASKCASELGFSEASALSCAEVWFERPIPESATDNDLYTYIEAALSPDVDEKWEEPELSDGIKNWHRKMAVNA